MADKNQGQDEDKLGEAGGEQPFYLEKIYSDTSAIFAPSSVPSSSDASTVVAIDTNGLLLPYTIGKDDLSELSRVYEALDRAKRLFVPARAAREFMKHRDTKLGEMLKAINDRRSRVVGPEEQISPLLEGVDGYAEMKAAGTKINTDIKEYQAAIAKLTDTIKAWRGDDPVTRVYRKVFRDENIIEHVGEAEAVSAEWDRRLKEKPPPGYKDSSKPDKGIGDYLIWLSLLEVGRATNKDLIFITGEEKADWFVRSSGSAVYPRPELVAEYRVASGGRCLRLSSLHELLRENQAPVEVVEEVEKAEAVANTAVAVGSSFMISDERISNILKMPEFASFHGVQNLSLGAGKHKVRIGGNSGFVIAFYVTNDLNLVVLRGELTSMTLEDSAELSKVRVENGSVLNFDARNGDRMRVKFSRLQREAGELSFKMDFRMYQDRTE